MDLKLIRDASERIATVVHRTPLLHSRSLSKQLGHELYMKGEHLQKTGSFKIRGAANKVIQCAEAGVRSVVTASSGNHGQAVAYIAGRLGISASVVVPEDAAACKTEAISAYGGTVVKCGITSEERLKRANEICEAEGSVMIPPYDDPAVMAGQGTIGLELLEQMVDVDTVFCPVGGGGLLAGVATAIKLSHPRIRVIGVEPELASDTQRSFHLGMRSQMKEHRGTTIADGLRTLIPGELTFPAVQKYVDDVITVSESQIKEAFLLILTRLKQCVEPSGAVSAAGALQYGSKSGKSIAILSGGNVDPQTLPSLIGN